MKTIRVRCTKGKVQITTKGFDGPACEAATAALEAGLGLNKMSDEHTEEYFNETVETEDDRLEQGN